MLMSCSLAATTKAPVSRSRAPVVAAKASPLHAGAAGSALARTRPSPPAWGAAPQPVIQRRLAVPPCASAADPVKLEDLKDNVIPWDQLLEAAQILEGRPEMQENREDMTTIQAALTLGPQTAWEVLDDVSVLEACKGVFGGFEDAAKISDIHLRLLGDCLVRGNVNATTAYYAAVAQLPPLLREQQKAVKVSVGAATLMWVREENEMVYGMLADAPPTSEGGEKAAVARAIVGAVDKVLQAMPEVDPQGDFV